MQLNHQEDIPSIDREFYIEHLIPFNNKTREYYELRTDRELIAEYELLIRLD